MLRKPSCLLLIASVFGGAEANTFETFTALREVAGESGQHRLKQYGEEFSWFITDTLVGLAFDLNFDLGIGYNLPFFSEGDFATINPKAYAQIGGTQKITLSLQVFQIDFLFDVVLYRFTFFDYLVSMDTVEWKELCSAMTWEGKTIDLSLRTHVKQLECIWGVLGLAITDQDHEDCEWVEYQLQKEWFNLPLMEDYNRSGNYIPYSCRASSNGQNSIEPL